MKARSLLLMVAVLLTVEQSGISQNLYKVRKYAFGVTGGILFNGTINAKSADEELKLDKNSAYLVKMYFDIIFSRSSTVGVFINLSELTFSNDNATASFRDTGIQFKYRFLFNKRFAIRPGLGFSYRFFGSSSEKLQNGGLGTNASLEFIYALTRDNTKLLADLGIMAQPFGKSNTYDITIPPIPYLTLGVAF